MILILALVPMALAVQGLNVDCPSTVAPGGKVTCKVNLNEDYSGTTSFGAQFLIDAPGFTADLDGEGDYVLTDVKKMVASSKSLGGPVVIFKQSKTQSRETIATFNLLAPATEKSYTISLKSINLLGSSLVDVSDTVEIKAANIPVACASWKEGGFGTCDAATKKQTQTVTAEPTSCKGTPPGTKPAESKDCTPTGAQTDEVADLLKVVEDEAKIVKATPTTATKLSAISKIANALSTFFAKVFGN
ncbi:hypothetical protein HOE52_03935 [Candidatus Woesearchaeota archaeon]|nr:hypothetical protein [Candidatus Woesearchaeota archaeon]